MLRYKLELVHSQCQSVQGRLRLHADLACALHRSLERMERRAHFLQQQLNNVKSEFYATRPVEEEEEAPEFAQLLNVFR